MDGQDGRLDRGPFSPSARLRWLWRKQYAFTAAYRGESQWHWRPRRRPLSPSGMAPDRAYR